VIGSIRVEGVSKRFSLFHERPRSLKEAVTLGRRRIYDEFWALQDVSFQVRPGETLGIIGANGSGKSTLLKCLARILTPDRGSIAVNGRVGALLELGAGFHPELTGRENVFLNGAILGVNRNELKARFDEIVALAGLERFIDTRVKNYSSGMYARLGFAIAVSLRPDVLLVDEVLAVGDEEFQHRSMAKLDELRTSGRTLVLVTHALDIVAQRCDRAVFLRNGCVAEIGPAPKVVAAYRQSVAVTADPVPLPLPATEPARRPLEILGVEVHGGGPGARVVAGHALEVVVDWRAHQEVQDLEIEVSISAGGITGPLGQAASRSTAGPAATPDRGRVRLRLPGVFLAPGDYVVSVALRARDLPTDGPPSIYALRIEPGPDDRARSLVSLAAGSERGPGPR
jgi:ABC-type polysaccharide/polyol phosphate transport system ATPase subunit